jgi:hypothetical protein
MLRIVMVAVIAVPLAAAAAHGAKHQAAPEAAFPKDAIEHAAKLCTDDGAFGRAFAGSAYGQVDTTAEAEWAPFEKLTIAGNEITAVASFDDAALARRYLKALEKAVEGKKHFKHRETHGSGMVFGSGKDAGTTLELRQDGDHVVALCLGD